MSGNEKPKPFTKQMRDVTREIHNVSDGLINAKLGIAMGEDSIWAEGLLVFYEIFKYLESALDRYGHTLIGDLDIEGMRRTDLFEQDLAHYLGEHWKKGYKPRDSVCNYLEHLKKLEKENPYLLSAYIYHLYMGLLSGGQILRKKRAFISKFSIFNNDPYKGLAVTEIHAGTVHSIKKKMNDAMNKLADQLDDDTKNRLLEESKMVFVMNNNMVYSIDGTGTIVAIKIIKYSIIGVLVASAFMLIKKLIYTGT